MDACKKINLMIVAFLLLSCLLSLGTTALADGEEPTVVNVGVYEKVGFLAIDENGEVSGYGLKFMQALAEYANIEYNFIPLTWSECMEQLLTGEIDIVTDARHSNERDELYGFSIQSIGQIQGALFVSKDMEDIYYNDFERMASLRVGFEKGALNKTLYEEFASQHGFTADTVEYASQDALLGALAAGEIDAIGDDVHLYTDDLKVISIYNTDPNYIMSKKGSEVMSRINDAFQWMYTQNPELISEQYTYLASQQMFEDMLLTREEAEYIAENPVLRVAVYSDRKPASWYDTDTGKFTGIAIEMMEKLSAVTGLTFEYVPVREGTTAIEMMNNGETDLAIPSIPTKYVTTGPIYQCTDPLFSLSISLAVKDEGLLSDGDGFTVAVRKQNTGIAAILNDEFENIRFQYYQTSQECIDAVKDGTADAYGNAIYDVEYQLKSPKNEDLHISYSYTCPMEYCIALPMESPDELLRILNSGIALLPEDDEDTIIRSYSSSLAYEMTLTDIFYQYRYFIAIALLFMLVIICAWTWSDRIQRRAMVEIRSKSSETERANAAKSEFLARMSHDMRTPLNGILGMSYLARKNDNPTDTDDCLRKINTSGEFLLGLVNDMLDMERINSGKIELNPGPYSLAEFEHYVDSVIRPLCENKGINFEYLINKTEDVVVLQDKLRINQLYFNLLSNAVKFTPEGGTVTFHTEVSRVDGRIALDTRISDTGIGMSRDFQSRMFEPFSQEKQDGVLENQGAGLGLSIVKKLCGLMNMTISVDSTLGKGTAFSLHGEFDEVVEAAASPGQVSPEQTAKETHILKGKKILLCEDQPLNQEITRRILVRVGMEVEIAANGKIGVELFSNSEAGAIAAVLMDIRMPVMDGMEAAKTIRGLSRTDAKDVPIIALTANAYREDIQKCRDAGMTACLAKPIEPETLYRTLEEELGLTSKPE